MNYLCTACVNACLNRELTNIYSCTCRLNSFFHVNLSQLQMAILFNFMKSRFCLIIPASSFQFLFPDAKSNKVEADKLDTGLGDTSDDMSSSKSDSSQALNEQSKVRYTCWLQLDKVGGSHSPLDRYTKLQFQSCA